MMQCHLRVNTAIRTGRSCSPIGIWSPFSHLCMHMPLVEQFVVYWLCASYITMPFALHFVDYLWKLIMWNSFTSPSSGCYLVCLNSGTILLAWMWRVPFVRPESESEPMLSGWHWNLDKLMTSAALCIYDYNRSVCFQNPSILMSGGILTGVRVFVRRNFVSVVFPIICFGSIAADYLHTKVMYFKFASCML